MKSTRCPNIYSVCLEKNLDQHYLSMHRGIDIYVHVVYIVSKSADPNLFEGRLM